MVCYWQNQWPLQVLDFIIFSLIKTTGFSGKLNEQHAFLMDVSLCYANTEQSCIAPSMAPVYHRIKQKQNPKNP